MTERTGSIRAIFGGQELIFAIDRERLEAFEQALGLPAYTVFVKFAGSLWSVSDLQRVLKFAAPHGYPERSVDDALIEQGPGHYSELALKILEASLFGLPLVDARFDENAPTEAA